MIKAPKWDEKYDLGIEQVDIQHKEIFDIIAKVYDLDDGPELRVNLKKILYELSNGIKKHFSDEEEYMKSIGFEYYKEHKDIHAQIVKDFNELIKKNNRLELLKTQLKIWAKKSFIAHVANEDTKMKFVSAKKVDKSIINEELYEL